MTRKPASPPLARLSAAARALERLPDRIKIGPFDYALVKMTANESVSKDRWGECSHVEATIRVSSSSPTPFKLVDTLLHEINHALYMTWDLDTDEKEESVARRLATGWACVFRDNPWLLTWLGECLS